MSTKINSRELDSHLEQHIPDSLEQKLASLKALGIDPQVFDKFHDKIQWILAKNPEAEWVVSGEIWKAHLSMENTMQNYQRWFKSILDSAANNPDWQWPDESLVA